MNDVDIASYIDVIHKNMKEPTIERSIFIHKHMPKFLEQMKIFYENDHIKFTNI